MPPLRPRPGITRTGPAHHVAVVNQMLRRQAPPLRTTPAKAIADPADNLDNGFVPSSAGKPNSHSDGPRSRPPRGERGNGSNRRVNV
jgi:hypothetical protein